MRDGEQCAGASELRRACSRAVVEPQLRWSIVAAHDLDPAPEHPLRVTGAERLHRRLLRREARGKGRCEILLAAAIGDLSLGEDALHEALAVALDRLGDPAD